MSGQDCGRVVSDDRKECMNDENGAVCYTRVSLQEQVRGGVSLAAQDERVQGYCKAAGLNIVEIIAEEGISGAKSLDTRPGGKQLGDLVDRKKVRHVVTLKLDRLFRDAEDALRQTRAWDKANIGLHIVDMGGQAMNTRSPMGRMILTMMSAFAELERNLIRERTSMALQHKKAHGQVYGTIPFGFERNGNILVMATAEQAIVLQLRTWRNAGWSLQRIADTLNQTGVGCKSDGKKWYHSTVNSVLKNSLHREVAA